MNFKMLPLRNVKLLRRSKYSLIDKVTNIRDQLKLIGPYKCFSSSSEPVKPIRMAFVQVAGPTTVDNNVPIVVMHGLFGSKTNWLSLGKAMTKDTQRKVYLVDARNHGDSPHSDEHSYHHMSEDIQLFMKENEIDKAALIGHSMGGRAMMAYALNHPGQVESLTVVDISPVGRSDSLDSMGVIFEAMNGIQATLGNSLSSVRKIVEAQLQESLKSKDLASFLSMNLGEIEKGKFSWKMNLQSLRENYDSNIKVFPITEGQFVGPTIFVCGAQSDFVNFQDIDKIKQLFPNAIFTKIENAGHWVHAEQPKKFLETVCKFINSVKH